MQPFNAGYGPSAQPQAGLDILAVLRQQQQQEQQQQQQQQQHPQYAPPQMMPPSPFHPAQPNFPQTPFLPQHPQQPQHTPTQPQAPFVQTYGQLTQPFSQVHSGPPTAMRPPVGEFPAYNYHQQQLPQPQLQHQHQHQQPLQLQPQLHIQPQQNLTPGGWILPHSSSDPVSSILGGAESRSPSVSELFRPPLVSVESEHASPHSVATDAVDSNFGPETQEPLQLEQAVSSKPSAASTRAKRKKKASVASVFDDLAMRFLMSLPAEEHEKVERLCFSVESAHWHYLDFYSETDPQKYPPISLARFVKKMFTHVPELSHFLETNTPEDIVRSFARYKQRVPVCGAIVLNKKMDKVLVVEPWGGKVLGFPRGKINQGELEADCAAREVHEETGLDLLSLGLELREEDSIQRHAQGHPLKLFLVAGVDHTMPLETRTRKEISKIEWVPVKALPLPGQTGSKRFANVVDMTADIKKWIKQRRQRTVESSPPTKMEKVQLEAPSILSTLSGAVAQFQQQERDRGGHANLDEADTFQQDEKASSQIEGDASLTQRDVQREARGRAKRQQMQKVHTAIPGQKSPVFALDQAAVMCAFWVGAGRRL